jgi:hypothetical protein
LKLDSISVGGGLALVAVALLANAAASLFGSTDRTAHADDLKRGAKTTRPIADVPVSRADEGGAEMVAMGDSGGCQLVEANARNWFGSIREIGDCGSGDGAYRLGGAHFSYADVNADGRGESFQRSGGYIYLPGTEVAPCSLALNNLSFDGEEVLIERSCVLTNAELAEWLLENKGWTGAYLDDPSRPPVWVDVDADGDLDLYLKIECASGCDTGNYTTIWLENTGFEKQTFAAGDINQDGEVDGVDISILLSDWTY